MKARTRQDKTAAPAVTRKLKVSKETLKDLTPSATQKDVRGAWSSVGGVRSYSNGNPYSLSKGA